MTSKYVCMCEYVTVCFPLRNWHVKTVQMICRGHGFENLCLCEKFLFFFLISLPSTTARRYHHHCHDHHGPPLLLRRERVAKFQIFLDLSLCAMRPVVSVCVCASVNSMSEALLVVRLEITNEHSVGLQYIKVTQELA